MRLVKILCLAALVVTACCDLVDTINILFPEVNDQRQRFPAQIISTEGAFYEWTSSAPEIAAVRKLETKEQSVSRCLVQLSQIGPYSSSVYITATSHKTSQVLKIPLRVRKLHKISISTKSRMMNVGEMQEIELFGFDKDNNTFTSLQGLRFQWTLQQSEKILQKLTIKEAHLKLPTIIREEMELIGLETDLIVVKALQPGNLVVRSQCLEREYENIFDEVTISVHESFELYPPGHTLLVIGSIFQFSLNHLNGDAINLPKQYYRITGGSKFKISEILLVTAPYERSQMVLRVEDMRTKPPYFSQITVGVEEPDEIMLVVPEYITVGQSYKAKVELYYRNRLMRGISRQVILSSDFPLNVQTMVLQCQSEKDGIILARFHNLNTQKIIHCTLPLEAVLPSNRIVLPEGQKFQLMILGGSGLYTYSLKKMIASVSPDGMIHTTKVGETELVVSDRKDPNNIVVIRLIVSEIVSAHSLEAKKQINLGGAGLVYISGRSSQGELFTRCDNSRLELSKTGLSFQNVKLEQGIKELEKHISSNNYLKEVLQAASQLKQGKNNLISKFTNYVGVNTKASEQLTSYVDYLENYGFCFVANVFGSEVFDRNLFYKLSVGDHFNQSSFNLRVYDILSTAVQESKNTFTLTPLSGLKWKTKGGSYKWDNSHRNTYLNGIKIKDEIPQLYCSEEEKMLNFELIYSNQQSQDLLFPVKQACSITLNCKFPQEIKLRFAKNNLSPSQLSIYQDTQVSGQVLAIDKDGLPYYNSSNLLYKFHAKNGDIQGTGSKFSYKPVAREDRVQISTREIFGLKKQFETAKATFDVNIVQPFQFFSTKQSEVIVPHFPNKEHRLSFKNKNEFAEVQCQEAVSCELQKTKEAIRLKTLFPGSGKAIIRDRSVYGMPEKTINFRVVEVDKIEIETNQTLLEVGERARISYYLFAKGEGISPILYDYKSFSLVGAESFERKSDETSAPILTAKKEGKYRIKGEMTSPKMLLSEKEIILEVYQPLKTNLASSRVKSAEIQMNSLAVERSDRIINIELINGCSRYLYFEEGPKDMQISVFKANSCLEIVKMSNYAFRISGTCLTSGITSAFFEAVKNDMRLVLLKIDFKISSIDSVEIEGNNRLLLRAQFRLIPRLIVGGRVSSLGSYCDFEYDWRSTDDKVIQIGQAVPGYLSAGGINATARGKGLTTVNLVIRSRYSFGIVAEASKQISVVQDVDLHYPLLIGEDSEKSFTLLVPPDSSLQLEDIYRIQRNPCDNQKIVEIIGNKIVTNDKRGGIGLTISRASNPDTYNTHVGLVVTEVASLFIQNKELIVLDDFQTRRLRYYMQDSYGRLFSPGVTNVNLSVRTSHPEVIKVTMLPQDHIEVTALRDGDAFIILELVGTGVRDVLGIKVGNALKPSSPVNVLQGGTVQFVTKQVVTGKWVSSNPDVASVDKKTGKVHALSLGSTRISNDDMGSSLNVLKIDGADKSEIFSIKSEDNILAFKLYWRIDGQLQQISPLQSNDLIDNDVKVQCECDELGDVIVNAQIVKYDDTQYLTCELPLPEIEQVSREVTVKVRQMRNKEIIGTFTHHLKEPVFYIPHTMRNITLSKTDPMETIVIRTSSKLDITVLYGKREWIRSDYSQAKKTLSIHLDMSDAADHSQMRIAVSDESYSRKEFINVKYLADSAGSTSSHQFLSRQWDWPDYLIVIMGAVFALLCLLQYFKNHSL